MDCQGILEAWEVQTMAPEPALVKTPLAGRCAGRTPAPAPAAGFWGCPVHAAAAVGIT